MLRKVWLVGGVLSSLLYVISIDVIAALRYPDYHNYADQMVSELLAVGAPTFTTVATVVVFGAWAGFFARPMPQPTPWLGLAERVNSSSQETSPSSGTRMPPRSSQLQKRPFRQRRGGGVTHVLARGFHVAHLLHDGMGTQLVTSRRSRRQSRRQRPTPSTSHRQTSPMPRQTESAYE